jgi:excisionase family DNA binding protein
MESTPQQDMLSYKQLSNWLNIPLGTLYSMVYQERIPYYRVSTRLVRFDRSEIAEWLKAGRVSLAEVTGASSFEG